MLARGGCPPARVETPCADVPPPIPSSWFLQGCAAGYGMFASPAVRSQGTSLPATSPACQWYHPGRNAATCSCLPCPAGGWSLGGELDTARCDPVQHVTLHLGFVLDGTCPPSSSTLQVLLQEQLPKDTAGYPGVYPGSATAIVISTTPGVVMRKVG